MYTHIVIKEKIKASTPLNDILSLATDSKVLSVLLSILKKVGELTDPKKYFVGIIMFIRKLSMSSLFMDTLSAARSYTNVSELRKMENKLKKRIDYNSLLYWFFSKYLKSSVRKIILLKLQESTDYSSMDTFQKKAEVDRHRILARVLIAALSVELSKLRSLRLIRIIVNNLIFKKKFGNISDFFHN